MPRAPLRALGSAVLPSPRRPLGTCDEWLDPRTRDAHALGRGRASPPRDPSLPLAASPAVPLRRGRGRQDARRPSSTGTRSSRGPQEPAPGQRSSPGSLSRAISSGHPFRPRRSTGSASVARSGSFSSEPAEPKALFRETAQGDPISSRASSLRVLEQDGVGAHDLGARPDHGAKGAEAPLRAPPSQEFSRRPPERRGPRRAVRRRARRALHESASSEAARTERGRPHASSTGRAPVPRAAKHDDLTVVGPRRVTVSKTRHRGQEPRARRRRRGDWQAVRSWRTPAARCADAASARARRRDRRARGGARSARAEDDAVRCAGQRPTRYRASGRRACTSETCSPAATSCRAISNAIVPPRHTPPRRYGPVGRNARASATWAAA